jgi:hypothetical protein
MMTATRLRTDQSPPRARASREPRLGTLAALAAIISL